MHAVEENGEEQIKTHRVTQDMMVDWCVLLDVLYADFTKIGIKKWQIFQCTDGTTNIVVKSSNLQDAEEKKFDMKKKDCLDEKRVHALRQSPTVLKAPGLREIKQVELFKNYRNLIPEEYRDELCPKLSDEVLRRVKGDTNEKKKE